MNFRMPVRNLDESYRELLPLLDEITWKVRTTPAELKTYAKHLNRPGVIFQYAYYAILVRQMVPASAVICDWGGQYGHLSKILRPYFSEVICYVPDRSEFQVEYFHSKFEVEDLVQFGGGYGSAHIALPDASVDVVISSGVLEHTREHGVTEEESLQEIWRVMRPGGTLFIWNLPRRWGSVELLNSALGRSIHPYKYGRRDILRLLEGAGFEVVLFDRHEFMNLSSRNALGKVIGFLKAWKIDYYLSKVVLFGALSQWFTIVARKPPFDSPLPHSTPALGERVPTKRHVRRRR